jgi:hypothetical protein
MSLEHSRKVIADIATTREADDYTEGLLKDAEMRADMERAEQPNKWDSLTENLGTLQQQPALKAEVELER